MTRPCPEIFRKRVVVEGCYRIHPPDGAFIEAFLLGLSNLLEMRPLTRVLVFSPDRHSDLHHGVAGFLPWVESGCSLYTWSEQRFFALEIFSCKDFDAAGCAGYAREQFQAYEVQWGIF
jgi:S-adenosylmethionine decarboxylase